MRLRRSLLPALAVLALWASAADAVVGPRLLTVMTYNVEHLTGTNFDPGPFGSVIGRYPRPDIVGLQELDRSWSRSGGAYQAFEIARRLHMNVYFDPNLNCAPLDEQNDGFCQYGTAILSRYPFVPGTARQYTLPTVPGDEPRGLEKIVVNVAGRRVTVYNTHLSFRPYDRLRQARFIAAMLARDRTAWVLTGDMNSPPFFTEIRTLRSAGGDMQSLAHQPGLRTTNTANPVRLDYVFAAHHIPPLIGSARVRLDALSDHRPLSVRIRIPGIPGPLL
jgi:endonuclease/exonuclease/phosphatase family metal-dependent hydrolase